MVKIPRVNRSTARKDNSFENLVEMVALGPPEDVEWLLANFSYTPEEAEEVARIVTPDRPLGTVVALTKVLPYEEEVLAKLMGIVMDHVAQMDLPALANNKAGAYLSTLAVSGVRASPKGKPLPARTLEEAEEELRLFAWFLRSFERRFPGEIYAVFDGSALSRVAESGWLAELMNVPRGGRAVSPIMAAGPARRGTTPPRAASPTRAASPARKGASPEKKKSQFRASKATSPTKSTPLMKGLTEAMERGLRITQSQQTVEDLWTRADSEGVTSMLYGHLSLHVTLEIAGKQIDCLLDTGAEQNVIRAELVDQLGLGELVDETCRGEVCGVGGKAGTRGIIPYLEVQLSGYTFPVSWIVTEGPLSVPALLGLPFMRYYGVSIDFSANRMHIGGREVRVRIVDRSLLAP